MWNTHTHQCTAVLRGHTAGVLSIAITDNVLVTASSDRTVRVWMMRARAVATALDPSASFAC
jgi:F-box and WD-40 domain protein 1/11